VSSCEISVRRLSPGAPGVQLLLYNPLAWRRSTPVRVPLGPHGAVAVMDAVGNAVVSQVTDPLLGPLYMHCGALAVRNVRLTDGTV
jgi:hypothetical protein